MRNLILQLSKFESPLFKKYEGIKNDAINNLENQIGYKLPRDFKNFLKISNGALILYENIYGIYENKKPNDLFENYKIEKNEVGNPIREHYLPIYPDGMGNHYCLDLKSLSFDDEKCNVIFWQHDRFYLEIDQQEIDQPEIDADSFTNFLINFLNELSEYYNYNGTKKK